MAAHSRILACELSCMGQTGGLQSKESQKSLAKLSD